jgi:hypothetical protein
MVQWIDAVLLGPGQPTLGENEFSKRQFNLTQLVSAFVKHPIAAVPIYEYIPNMEYPVSGDNRATHIRSSPFWASTIICCCDVF